MLEKNLTALRERKQSWRKGSRTQTRGFETARTGKREKTTNQQTGSNGMLFIPLVAQPSQNISVATCVI